MNVAKRGPYLNLLGPGSNRPGGTTLVIES